VDAHTRTLIERAQARDPAAAEELFGRYRERLRAALKRLVRGRYAALADSEDAVQDALLKAFAKLERFEYRGEGSFLAWLLRCAENEVLQRLRALSARKRDAERVRSIDGSRTPELVSPEPSPSQIAGGNELEERVRAGLDALPEREREVIFLRRYLALENEEIRAELDLPTEGAVRALLSRAQARLARWLEEGGAGAAAPGSGAP
jgi:RNA polymerase sigma factor (sigma-70 family)